MVVSGAAARRAAACTRPASCREPLGEALAGHRRVRAGRGIAALALWPFAAVIAPIFAADAGGLPARRSFPALAVARGPLLVGGRRRTRSSRRPRRRPSGGSPSGGAAPTPVVRAAPFTLAPRGRPETAILWKNTILLGRYVSVAVLVRVLIPIVVLAVVVGLNRKGGSLAPLVLMLACFMTLIGPYMVRNDLRHRHAAAAGAQDVADQRAGTAARRTARARGRPLRRRLVPAGRGVRVVRRRGRRALATRSAALAVALAVAVLAPMLIAGQLLIQNAAVVLFPGWIATGGARARGVEAMGQNMLMFAGDAPGAGDRRAAGRGRGWRPRATLLYLVVGWLAVLPAAIVMAGILARRGGAGGRRGSVACSNGPTRAGRSRPR